MIKEILLLSAIVSITACKSYSPESQCDPEKNYIKSNPIEMEKFKNLKKAGKVDSIYTEVIEPDECNDNACVTYDENYKYVEKYFDDRFRKGVYTVKSSKIFNTDCMDENPATSNRKDKYCYTVTHNQNDKIKSEYKWSLDRSNPDVRILRFDNIKTNTNLFIFSYQVYTTGAIGGPGGGVCPQSYTENKNYKFNPYNFN